MSQHKPNEHHLTRIVHFGNQPVGISFDVEDRANASEVGMREIAARIDETPPMLFQSPHTSVAMILRHQDAVARILVVSSEL